MSADQYDADYFLRGKQSGKSLYEDYRWLPDLTLPMSKRIVDHLGIAANHTVVDFGCARGYTVKALRLLGYQARGVDVSRWAIDNCDPDVREHVQLVSEGWPEGDVGADWIIAKDVLEHVYFVSHAVVRLMRAAARGILVVVPLSTFNGGRYVIEQYEQDITHCQRHTLPAWVSMFLHDTNWRVECSYRLPGVKDNWYQPGWERGNGFITARRITS